MIELGRHLLNLVNKIILNNDKLNIYQLKLQIFFAFWIMSLSPTKAFIKSASRLENVSKS